MSIHPQAPTPSAGDTRPRNASTTPVRELLSPDETARRLRMSRATLYNRIKDGTLAKYGLVEANRLTGRRYFFADSVDRVLSKRLVGR